MDVKEQIRRYIAENMLLDADGFTLGDDESLLEEGVVDSTGVLELVVFVEETFGFKVPDDEVVPDNFDSINNLSAFIQRMTG